MRYNYTVHNFKAESTQDRELKASSIETPHMLSSLVRSPHKGIHTSQRNLTEFNSNFEDQIDSGTEERSEQSQSDSVLTVNLQNESKILRSTFSRNHSPGTYVRERSVRGKCLCLYCVLKISPLCFVFRGQEYTGHSRWVKVAISQPGWISEENQHECWLFGCLAWSLVCGK
jgi:hypothetical protein